jgi:RNA-directed DNA polymerase
MGSQIVSTKLQRIAEQAVNELDKVFTSTMNLVDVDFLKEAYQNIRKDAAPGLDGITARQYGENLEENPQNLFERMRTGRYRAPAVKRIWIERLKKHGSTGLVAVGVKVAYPGRSS